MEFSPFRLIAFAAHLDFDTFSSHPSAMAIVTQNNRGSRGVTSALRLRVSRARNFFKALLVCVLALAPLSAASAHTSHFSLDRHSNIETSANLSGDKTNSDTGPGLLGGLEHHACSSPCLSIPHLRSYYVVASFEGARIRYPVFTDADRTSFKPDPLQKPPRLTYSA
jgi:hypothetical protein